MSDPALLQQQLRGIRQRLNQLRMPELRNILMDLNLARSGRKSELVERIAMELESFAAKAQGSSSTAFYAERLAAGMLSIDRQANPRRAPQPPSPRTPPGQVLPSVYHMPQQLVNRYPPPQQRMPTRPVPAFARNMPPSMPYGAVAPTTPGSVTPLTSGVDLYNPRNSPSLDGARCFCPSQHLTGKVVPCVSCGTTVHAKCHQLITLVGEWYCEMCRAKLYDPFFQVQKTVLVPSFVRFAKSTCSFRLEYYVTDNDLNNMYAKRDPKPGSMTPGSLELQLRCFALKEDLGAGHCWPPCTHLSVNGFGVPITQRAPPGHANPSKVLRELPANIFQYTRVGRNVIDIRTNENPSVFGFMVQIVETRNIDDLISEVKEASKNLTYEGAKQEVIKSFGSEDDDDIVATCTMLSVRCPLGLCVINLPVRGVHCKHLQCVDLKTFMMFSKKARSKAWRCTVCHHFIKVSDLRIDPYLKKILAEVKGEDELEEVEIFPDGSWKRREDDEIVPEPPSKKVKAEQVEVGAPATNGSSASAAAQNETPGSSASAPVEIDLLSSDDEDDEPPVVPTRKPAASSSVAPPRSTTPILLDDELDILTVQSDTWDANPSASGAASGSADGNCGEYFPFPLDESVFPSNGSAANNSGGMSWMNSVPVSTIVSSMPPPSVAGSNTSATTSTTVSPPRDLMNSSESSLASSMASLSRNHPNVSNPFEQRQRRQARPPAKPTTAPSDMDIICLLDSDSD